jgi:MoaA/NifB/PqqE/SkfB family radical SAM enzyme
MVDQIERPSTALAMMDGHKLPHHMDRVDAWRRGERIAPVTIDMALTRKCDAACGFCYAMLQENERHELTWPVLSDFLDDAKAIGVKAVSLLSDGESMLSRHWVPFVQKARAIGLDIAAGSNCHAYTPERQEDSLGCLSYIRINFPAGEKKRYCEIMGVPPKFYDTTVRNIENMVALKKRKGLDTVLTLQMVCLPQDADQIIPFVKLGKELGVDACTIKHVADDEDGSLGMDYQAVKGMIPALKEAQKLATPDYQVIVMWNKILEGMTRPYHRCRGPQFMLQISGSGLVTTCGDKMNDRYAKFHIGNIAEQRFMDIFHSERYWEVMGYLASEEFDAQKSCGPLCRQNAINAALDAEVTQGKMIEPATTPTIHRNFI